MEAAAAAAGFASLAAQVFQGCVQAIVFFQAAQRIGVDGDLFRLGLEVQWFRLMRWADRVGLLEGAVPSEKINWHVATAILQHLEVFLTSADQLSRKYSLIVTEEDVSEVEKQQALEPPKQGLAKTIARMKPDIYAASAKIIQSSNGTIKRLRWAAMGKDKAKGILESVSRLIDNLQILLDSVDQERRSAEDSRLLRTFVSYATNLVETGHVIDLVPEVPRQADTDAIRDAASVKQVRLVLGADVRADESVPSVGTSETRKLMPQLKTKTRALQPWQGDSLRMRGAELAAYRDVQVLVQWKVAEGPDWAKYTDNMKRLAVLLTAVSHQSFHTLRCEGYHAAEAKGRHGIIFSMPPSVNPTSWDIKTLRAILEEKKYASLRRRIYICQALAQAVLQLHTAGWMHKNLNPDNIVFFAPTGSATEMFLQSEPYIIGFDYARPDSVEAAAITELPESDLYGELYRHPKARGPERETFQKRFDMYALGCLLLELAMWEPLIDYQSRLASTNPSIDLRKTFAEASAANSVIEVPSALELVSNSQHIAELQHRAGESFAEAVLVCLTMERVVGQDEAELSSQIAVVERLDRCQV